MSIALDVGLFFRNSKTKLGLSLSARAIIFTLAFRVGSKASTWISPQTLADECGIHRQNIFEPLQKIVDSGIVLKKDSQTHKQKKVYAFSDLIINYHQMSDASKKKVHEALNDEYDPVDKFKNQSGKPDQFSKNQSGKPDSNQSGKPDWSLTKKNLQDLEPCGLQGNENSPKAKEESNIKEQREREAPSQFDQTLSFKSEENLKICFEKNLKIDDEIKKFTNYYKNKPTTVEKFTLWITRAFSNSKNKMASNDRSLDIYIKNLMNDTGISREEAYDYYKKRGFA